MKEIIKKHQRSLELLEYDGNDKIVLAETKRQEIVEENKTKPPFAALSGFSLLDDCTKGFRKGQLVVLSGPPKNGKTQMCQTFTKHFTDIGLKCVWFSYELGYEEFFEKFPMSELKFYVPNYLENGNLDWIEDKIIEAQIKYNTQIVFIDHLDFLRDPADLKKTAGVNHNLSSYVGGIVQRIKRMAVLHDVVIFLMAHITKNRWTTNELPTSEQLRDSGQIAQLADIVLMVVRKRLENKLYDGNLATLGIMENRKTGMTAKISMELRDNLFIQLGEEDSYEKSAEKDYQDLGVSDRF